MRVDTNTKGHCQWYYFSIRNREVGTIKINIYRFKKVFSLYQRGMKPYVFSRKSKQGWKAKGKNINYHLERKTQEYDYETTNSYILSFNYTFQYQEDETFFAACIPYSYTYLLKQLSYFQSHNQNNQNIKFQVSTLCKSMCGSQVPLVTIESVNNIQQQQKREKKFIIINCRTHSGQSSGSWVMQGLLNELCANNELGNLLSQKNICLKLVPMLNPDGVFIGNYRTGIMGDDFNRNFLSGKKEFFSEIHGLKKLINDCKKNGKVQLFLDLHGHSVLKNSFIYGPLDFLFEDNQFKLLPQYLSQSSKYFRLSSCRFKIDNKIQTARRYFQSEFNIMCMTIQNSLGLYSQLKQTSQMLANDWKTFGASIVTSFQQILSTFNPTSFRSLNLKNREVISNAKKYGEAKSKRSSNLIRIITETQYEQKKQIKFRTPGTSIKLKPIQSSSRDGKQYQNLKSVNLRQPKKFVEEKQVSSSKLKSKLWKGSQILERLPTELKQKILCHLDAPSKEIFNSKGETPSSNRKIYQNTQQPIQLNNQNALTEVILENLSQNYESINDSDNSSQSLQPNEKKYLHENIRKNINNKTIEADSEDYFDKQIQEEDKTCQKQININKFRQYKFKMINFQKSLPKFNMTNHPKKSKKDPKRFKEYNNMSIREYQSSNVVESISKKKKLTQRILEKINMQDI